MVGRITASDKKRTGVIDVINQNNSLIISAVFLILGLIAGTLYFKGNNSGGTYYKDQFGELISGLKSGFLGAFKSEILELLPFAVGVFLSGTCMVGGVLIPALLFIRGGSMGLIMSYAYSSLGLNGILFNLLIIIPSGIISTLALILAARESMGFSLSLARLARPDIRQPVINKDFRLFCLRQLFVTVFFLVAALFKAIMSVAFMGFFRF